jgi:ABC-2 type transport system permease protein
MKYWREIIAVTQRILIELLRRRRSLIFWSIFPISVLILSGFILSERAQLPINAAFEYAAPSTLVGAAMWLQKENSKPSNVCFFLP